MWRYGTSLENPSIPVWHSGPLVQSDVRIRCRPSHLPVGICILLLVTVPTTCKVSALVFCTCRCYHSIGWLRFFKIKTKTSSNSRVADGTFFLHRWNIKFRWTLAFTRANRNSTGFAHFQMRSPLMTLWVYSFSLSFLNVYVWLLLISVVFIFQEAFAV